MPNFKYKAIKQSGERYEEVKEATDKSALYHQLKKEGDVVIFAEEIKEKKLFDSFKNFSLLGRIRMQEKILFAHNLSSMIEAGLPLTRALSIMEKQTKHKKFKTILGEIYSDINRGLTLSQAMAMYPEVFSTLFISMVKAGEEGGKLSDALKIVAEQLEKSNMLYKKIKGAMMYPAVIFSVMIIIGIMMMMYVVPTLTSTFKEMKMKLPMSTRAIIFVSDFLKNNTLVFFGSAVVVIFLLVLFFRTSKGKRLVDFLSLRIPVISGLIKETNAARTGRTLSSLLSSGVDYLIAIRITKDVIQNSYYKEVLAKAEAGVEKGNSLSKIFLAEEKLYPLFVGEMTGIGEETGKLSEMFLNIAEYYEKDVDQKTKDMSTIVEPFLMVIIGVAVGFFALSMIGPMYSLVDAI